MFASKVFLFLLVGCLLAVFILCQKEKYSEHAALFWLLMLPILGQTFQPIWFFQGIERMGFITVFVVVARSLYVFLVFFLVSSPEDLNWVVISNGISQIVAAVIALFFLLRLGITPLWPGRSFIKSVFFESVQFFWSRIAASTYTLGGVFYLGLFSTPNAVAFYSAADQLYRGAQSLIHPLSQALYPYMARTHDLDFFKKTIKTLVLICIIGLVLGVLVSDWLIVSIFGIQFGDSTPVLRVFMFTLFATSISIMLGYPLLGAFGMSAQANKSVIYAGILQAFLLVVLWSVNARDELYVAITVLVVEVFVFIYRASFARRVLQA